MNGADGGRVKWKNIKQRLGLSVIGCCGATWGPTITTIVDQDEHDEIPTAEGATDPTAERITSPLLMGRTTGPMMNLAMALAAERNVREVGPTESNAKTLMRLIEETDGVDWKIGKKRKDHNGGGAGSDWLCCVCFDRSKGAAFIPCGHAFCRICSRELWTNRGSCPICNRSILQILNIF